MSNFVAKDGLARFISDAPPTHFIFKIESFSLLTKNAIDKYESGEFEAEGHKWKLILHPNGNKTKKVEDHISLYMALSDTSSLGVGFEIKALIELFLFDQKEEKYLIVKGDQRRFNSFNLERGYDHFVPIEEFTNPANGYLVEDTCVFGADVFVKKNTIAKGECLSFIKDAPSFKHVWKIENFSKIGSQYVESEVFNAGGHKWRICLYPKGNRDETDGYLSLYLDYADKGNITPPSSKICVNYTLRIMDQVQGMHKEIKSDNDWVWFSAGNPGWGWHNFVSLDEFNQSGKGYVVKDACVVEAEVTVLGIAKAM